jgi:hypothetical protein
MKIKDLLEAEDRSLVGMEIKGKVLPVEGKWEGDFYCYDNQLISQRHSPADQ